MVHKLAKIVAFAVAVMFIVTTFAVASEMICSKDDGKMCTMAKDAMGKEMAVMSAGVKVGEKLDCTSQDGKMACKKLEMMKEKMKP